MLYVMGWSVYHAFLADVHEADILEKYGTCCEVPLLRAVYALDRQEDDEPQEGHFISYDCMICGSNLYTSDIGHSPYKWV